MAQDIKNLQALINDKADARLEADLRQLQARLTDGLAYTLLGGQNSINIKIRKFDIATDSYIDADVHILDLFTSRGLCENIRANNRERYRAEEAAAFVNTVQQVKKEVDQLLNNDY